MLVINKRESSRYGVTKTSLGIVLKIFEIVFKSFTDMSQKLPHLIQVASFLLKLLTFFYLNYWGSLAFYETKPFHNGSQQS